MPSNSLLHAIPKIPSQSNVASYSNQKVSQCEMRTYIDVTESQALTPVGFNQCSNTGAAKHLAMLICCMYKKALVTFAKGRLPKSIPLTHPFPTLVMK